MAVKIVVLDDGETWAGSAQVWTITDEAYERLNCEGLDANDLCGDEVLKQEEVNTDDD